MLMSVIEGSRSVPAYPELAGKRVLITGLTSACGVDIVRAFAEHRARLVLQLEEMSERTEAIAEIAAPMALDIKAFGPVAAEADAVAQFARSVMMAFGGLDVVVNLVPLTVPRLAPSATTADIERMVVERLMLPCLLSRIAANRMALVLTEGLILNVAMLAPPVDGPAQAFASRREGGDDRHDAGPGRGVGGQGDPLQCHRPADACRFRPAQPRRRAGGRGTGAVSGLGPRQGAVGAACSRPSRRGSPRYFL